MRFRHTAELVDQVYIIASWRTTMLTQATMRQTRKTLK